MKAKELRTSAPNKTGVKKAVPKKINNVNRSKGCCGRGNVKSK